MTHDVEIATFESAEAFEAWLGENHAVSPGIWLKLRRKGPGVVALDYVQALDTALCHGWIDGQKAKFDDQWWLQRFTPRKPRSKWSKVNRDKAAALMEQGRMRPAGQAEVDRAKADGRWDAAYDGAKTATVPDDLAAALTADPAAAAFFETLDRQNARAVRSCRGGRRRHRGQCRLRPRRAPDRAGQPRARAEPASPSGWPKTPQGQIGRSSC